MSDVLVHVHAHDIIVPVAVQTQELRQILDDAFAAAGLSMDSFTVGSATQAINDATGYPEF